MKNRPVLARLFCGAAVLAVFPLLTACTREEKTEISAYDLEWGSQESFADIGKSLKTLGISGITDELLEEMERSYADMEPEILMNKTAVLLTVLGSGQYNEDLTEWMPDNDSVYAFDMEVFRVEHMYTDFLNGIRMIGGGALDFENVTENMDNVDWENGTGTRQVTFEWGQKQYTLEAEVQNDWFDPKVLEQLNDIIAGTGEQRRLYATTDGYQSCIIFFCDKDWADGFFEKTGLLLSQRAG